MLALRVGKLARCAPMCRAAASPAAGARRFASKKRVAPPSAAEEAAASSAAEPRVTKEMVTREVKEIVKLMIGGVAVVGGLLASGGFVIETARALNPPDAPGSKIEIATDDGQRVSLHVQTRGSGDTTVIFDGGVGETSFDWDKVVEQVAGFAKVVSVDRPGLAYSAPAASVPRTSTQIANEYKQLLDALHVQGKVVLVAHGAGGYNMRELAAELESAPASDADAKCVGIVLVDALEEHLRGELESVSDQVRASLAAMDSNGDTVLWLSRFGVIRLINFVQIRKFTEKYSPAALPFVQHYSPSPAHRQGVQLETQALPLTEQHFRDAAPSASAFAFPCIVLSHGKRDMFAAMKVQSGVDDATIDELERKWSNAQDKLAQTVSKRSERVVVRDAGHAIHHERPDEIARAVRKLVEQARSEKR